jgi:hypothetical protein
MEEENILNEQRLWRIRTNQESRSYIKTVADIKKKRLEGKGHL